MWQDAEFKITMKGSAVSREMGGGIMVDRELLKKTPGVDDNAMMLPLLQTAVLPL